MTEKKKVVIASSVAAGVFLLSLFVLQYSKDGEMGDVNTSSEVETTSEEDMTEEEVESALEPYRPTLPDNLEDITEEEVEEAIDLLEQFNVDIGNGRGWLRLPNTRIDYPLMQASNNSYYLNHNIYGGWTYNGSIYLDYRCSADFSDFCTVIYGHNMKDGTCFADLDYYTDQTFFANNPTAWLVLKDRVCTLDVVACAVVYGNDYIFNFQCELETEKEEWLADYTSKAKFIREGVPFDEKDRYLLLTTCTDSLYGGSYKRVTLLCRINDPFEERSEWGGDTESSIVAEGAESADS